MTASGSDIVEVSDITIQNRSQGDGYVGRFIFLSPFEAERQRDTDQ